MVQVSLDTETTGKSVEDGHRIIEIGCVRIIDRVITENVFHRLCDPQRDIDRGAIEVHGITREQLQGKPRFGEIIPELLDYIDGAELIIHNAAFDLGFLNAELQRAGHDRPLESRCAGVVDSLQFARQQRPGSNNSLDGLCQHFNIDLSQRDKHSALTDARLLAQVWLKLTAIQETLLFDSTAAQPSAESLKQLQSGLRVIAASEQELQLHNQWLDEMDQNLAAEGKQQTLWRQLEAAAS